MIGQKKEVRAIAFSPNGQLLASAGGGLWRGDRIVRPWRVENGELVRTLEGHSEIIISVAFSPYGRLLASGSHDRTVALWAVRHDSASRIAT